MKYHFILNLAAGKGNMVEKTKQSICDVCESRGIDYVIYDTKCVGDATIYIKNILDNESGTHRFYACGGDGTLSEVIDGACGNDRAEVGIIPIGTGNDFCRNFTNKDNFFDIERQLDGKAISIDAMEINGRKCVNMINIGFDCNVADTVSRIKRKKILPGKFAYIAGIVINFFKKFGTNMKLTIGDETIDGIATLCAISGGGFCGGGFYSSPLSSICDGMLDVYYIKKISRFTFIKIVSAYKNGTYLETKLGKRIVLHANTKKLKLDFDEPINVCVDGEIEKANTIEIICLPNAVRFAPPKDSLLIEQHTRKMEEPAMV